MGTCNKPGEQAKCVTLKPINLNLNAGRYLQQTSVLTNDLSKNCFYLIVVLSVSKWSLCEQGLIDTFYLYPSKIFFFCSSRLSRATNYKHIFACFYYYFIIIFIFMWIKILVFFLQKLFTVLLPRFFRRVCVLVSRFSMVGSRCTHFGTPKPKFQYQIGRQIEFCFMFCWLPTTKGCTNVTFDGKLY